MEPTELGNLILIGLVVVVVLSMIGLVIYALCANHDSQLKQDYIFHELRMLNYRHFHR